MIYLYIFIGITVFAAIISLCAALYIYKQAFYFKFDEKTHDCIRMKEIENYGSLKNDIIELIKKVKSAPYEEVSIKSYDGLNLYGKLYLIDENADFEIVFHGYKSCPYHDCGGAWLLAKERGHNLLLPDQRCHGKSEGKMICYGIRERFDAQKWCEYIAEKYPNRKIVLEGVSMGASTALMASDLQLPSAVKGIISDSGFSSAEGNILKVASDMKLNPNIIRPFLRLSTLIFGKFGINDCTPVKSVKNAKLPILFIHGNADSLVPYEMSEELYSACTGEKYFLMGENADHGLTFFADKEKYKATTGEFIEKVFRE